MSDDERPEWIVTKETVKELLAEGHAPHFINNETLSLRGRAVKIDTTDTADIPPDARLVCGPFQRYNHPSSLVGACDTCGRPIVYRASAPTKIIRVCVPCAVKQGLFD